jgi:hypothetical protein
MSSQSPFSTPPQPKRSVADLLKKVEAEAHEKRTNKFAQSAFIRDVEKHEALLQLREEQEKYEIASIMTHICSVKR